LVKPNQAVTKGETVAVQRNGFGDIVHTYKATADGRVAIIGTDAASERGSEIVTILVNRPSCTGGQCDYGSAEE
jgi:predicted deacylase